MQRSELAEDGVASEATARPDELTTENTSDEPARDADPAEESAVDEPIENESHASTESGNGSATAQAAEGLTAPEPTSGDESGPGPEVTTETAPAAAEAPTAQAPVSVGSEAAVPARTLKPSPRPRATPPDPEPTVNPATDEAPSEGEVDPAAAPARPFRPSPRPRPASSDAEPAPAQPAPRPFKPSPRPRSAPAKQPVEASAPAEQPVEAAAWTAPVEPTAQPGSPVDPSAEQTTPAEQSVEPAGQVVEPAAEAEEVAPGVAPPPGLITSPGWDHLAEDDHSADPPPPAPVKDPEAGARARKRWGRRAVVAAGTIALMLFIPAFIVRMYGIPSESMETTLHGCAGCDNDRVLVDRTVYRFRDPHPGEVVVFTAGQNIWSNSEEQDPGESNPLIRGLESLGEMVGIAPPSGTDFVKRVIAVGGQTVSCCDSRNRILVDGVPVDEPYVYFSLAAGPAKQTPFPKIKVPDGMMWMMGDNRNASLDSRAPGNGPVPVSALAGKVRMIIYPLSRIGSVDDTNPQQPR